MTANLTTTNAPAFQPAIPWAPVPVGPIEAAGQPLEIDLDTYQPANEVAAACANKARMSPADEAQVLNEALDDFGWLMFNNAVTHELHGRFMGLVDRLFDGDVAAGRLLAALCHRNPVGCAMLLLRENAESYAREVPEARGWAGQWMHVLDVTPQALDQRLRSKTMKVETLCEMASELGYRLVLEPVETSAEKIEIEG